MRKHGAFFVIKCRSKHEVHKNKYNIYKTNQKRKYNKNRTKIGVDDMGMYTQIRGWLNVNSIGDAKEFQGIKERLETAQEDFKNSDVDADRKWICQDTVAHMGGNGSAFLFFGTELKNYTKEAEKWIEFLLKYFPNAEGRIDFQYEGEEPWDSLDEQEDSHSHQDSVGFSWSEEKGEGSKSKYYLIRGGAIIKEDWDKTWCYGYGNMMKNL